MLAPWRVLRISSDGDDRGIFLGLKFSIPGICWVGKFGKLYFCGWLDSRSDFFAYSKQSEVAFCIMVLMKQEMLLGVLRVVRIQKARKFGMGFFWGLIFAPGVFSIGSSPSLKIQSTPWDARPSPLALTAFIVNKDMLQCTLPAEPFLAYSKENLHDLSKVFVEHALHVARKQF